MFGGYIHPLQKLVPFSLKSCLVESSVRWPSENIFWMFAEYSFCLIVHMKNSWCHYFLDRCINIQRFLCSCFLFLPGGETAEMPDMYAPGEYDLAGFAIGAMERDQKLPHLERIMEGDVVIGVASSGLHSNGFSLVRKIVAKSSLQYSSPAPDGCGNQTLGTHTHV